MLIEESLHKSSYDVRVFVVERHVRSLAETAKLTDVYTLIYSKRQQKDDDKNQLIKSDGATQREEVSQRQRRRQCGASYKF